MNIIEQSILFGFVEENALTHCWRVYTCSQCHKDSRARVSASLHRYTRGRSHSIYLVTNCPGECSCTIPRSNRSDSCTQEYNRAPRNISIRRHTSFYRRSLFRKHHQRQWIDRRILKKWNKKRNVSILRVTYDLKFTSSVKLIRKLFREILDLFLSKRKNI